MLNLTRPARFAAFALLMAGITGAAQARDRVTADTILTNARIYTVDKKQPWAQSVAIRDGKIVAVGPAAAVAKTRGVKTRIVDLGGRLVLPAFGDAHAHPLFGALSKTRCSLHDGKTIEDYKRIIAKCVSDTPGTGTVYGVGWEDSLFPPNGVPNKAILDAISTTRPLIFDSVGGHTNWVNSKALELAGITKDTPNPVNGTIDRDPATGEPVGSLQESAQALVAELIPPPTDADYQSSILYTARLFNSLGIVAWNDAGVEFDDAGGSRMVDAYKAVKDAGKLTTYVSVSLKWKNERGMDQFPGLLKAAERANALGIPTHTVKFYVDGVIPQKTAYMLAPYEGDTQRGAPQIAPDTLKQAVTATDAKSMHAFLHAIGDGGVRLSLDAVEAARKANGAKPTYHMVTHLNVVDPADQPRFGRLDTYAQFQPTWSSWYPYMELTEAAIGKKRMEYIYPAGSIVRAGGKLAYGADWPVATANPLEGLEVAITRQVAGDPKAKPLVASEGVSLAEAIESHTLNVAAVNGMAKFTGSLEAGKNADLVVLDKDIFKLPVHQISKAKVLVTLFQGKAVYGDLGALKP
ncbi:amidohydrolase [Sphingomonas sp. BT-65]|uniref:amidohydrolase n=1 Tax=Sphingomonas sp. BT-65 TaxID=2989821 RepID=UPI00223602EA|nr:amidohydrolase [Sphingomonas sp. BT-65]MCW4460689.1 amidohydrolase [Sphingomonas sp. BT-65]